MFTFFFISGVAEGEPLTFERALTLAREHAPRIAAARIQLEEARGRLLTASAVLRDNPEIVAGAGPRTAGADHSIDREISVTQALETGGRRGARLEEGRARFAEDDARTTGLVATALRDVGRAFYRTLHAMWRMEALAENRGIAEAIAASAAERERAGEVAALDVNTAMIAAARASADALEAEASREESLGRLAILLDVTESEIGTLTGELRHVVDDDLDSLLRAASARPDVRRLEAEVARAEAESRLGKALLWPDVSVGARYAREEAADVALGVLTVSLPLFETGHGRRVAAASSMTRRRIELDALRRSVEIEVRTLHEAYEIRMRAADDLGSRAGRAADENQALARRSYQEGELDLPSLLFVRREGTDARLIHLDRLLEAALTGLELELAAGVLR